MYGTLAVFLKQGQRRASNGPVLCTYGKRRERRVQFTNIMQSAIPFCEKPQSLALVPLDFKVTSKTRLSIDSDLTGTTDLYYKVRKPVMHCVKLHTLDGN